MKDKSNQLLKTIIIVSAFLALVSRTTALAARFSWAKFSYKQDDWFRSAEGVLIADNILSWQSLQGSWPKNVDTAASSFSGNPSSLEGTFDNGATIGELRFLARSFRVTNDKRYEQAFLRGLDHILKAQYPIGGWPQSYPLKSDYRRHITFNDGVTVGLMRLLQQVVNSPDYEFVDSDRRKSTKAAFDRGIECILKCQIKVNDKLTGWCSQHDELDYSPRPGRSYELISISGSQSANILQLLMSLANPSAEVIRAVQAGIEWLESVKITGIRQIVTDDDRVIVEDPYAKPLWARFYEVETNRPIFAGRDGVKKYNMSEIKEVERRYDYVWYGRWGEFAINDYENWSQKWIQKPLK